MNKAKVIGCVVAGITATVAISSGIGFAGPAEPAKAPAPVSSGSTSPVVPKIAGGQDSEARSFAVNISNLPTGTDQSCTGSLIAPDFVLTAGHCALDENGDPFQPEDFELRIGSADRTTGGELVKPKSVQVHPDFTGSGPNDLALMELERPVDLQPVEIDSVSPADATPVELLGWGITCADRTQCPGTSPKILQKLDAEVEPDATCLALGNFSADLDMCIKTNPEHTTCNGDSGGPVLVDGKLVGLTSRSEEVCGQSGAVSDVDVTKFRDFIDEVTGGSALQGASPAPAG